MDGADPASRKGVWFMLLLLCPSHDRFPKEYVPSSSGEDDTVMPLPDEQAASVKEVLSLTGHLQKYTTVFQLGKFKTLDFGRETVVR